MVPLPHRSLCISVLMDHCNDKKQLTRGGGVASIFMDVILKSNNFTITDSVLIILLLSNSSTRYI